MDPILYWNDVALEANRRDFSRPAPHQPEQGGPTLSSRALAIVHLAMYDAFVGADKLAAVPSGLSHYLPGLPAAGPGASVDAATSAAAHGTLSALFPSQKDLFEQKHAEAGLADPDPTKLMKGHDFGHLVAQRMLAARKDDPGAGGNGYAPSMARGAHRPDPDNPEQGYHAPFYGERSTCFVTKKRYVLAPPPALGDPAYLAALREVRGKGIAPELEGTATGRRLPLETLIGLYWAYDGANGIGTPPRLYNQIVREVAKSKANSPAKNAELFALVNAAMGDAGILAWEQKYRYNLWRPVVGIREHDPSMGPTGMASNAINADTDPLWLPLGAPSTNAVTQVELPTGYPTGHASHRVVKNFTPPFPAYPSGHATFGAAALHAARLHFGIASGNRSQDPLFANLSLVSDELNGVNSDNRDTVRPRHVRNFPQGLWQMIEENGRSRVYLGVHWVFDAFAVNGTNQTVLGQAVNLAASPPVAGVGGVPLGLAIAEDIVANGLKSGQGIGPV
jgi:vanadium chloroperoxidase